MRGLCPCVCSPRIRQCGVLSPAFLCKIKVTVNKTAAAFVVAVWFFMLSSIHIFPYLLNQIYTQPGNVSNIFIGKTS
jgi:hypothetical protein